MQKYLIQNLHVNMNYKVNFKKNFCFITNIIYEKP